MSAFPQAARNDVLEALNAIPAATYWGGDVAGPVGSIVLRGEALHVPYRVAFPEPGFRGLSGLTETQKVIVAAIYTRHGDGHVRERWLETLLPAQPEWQPVFVIQLIGEYVIEIIQLVARKHNLLRRDLYESFVKENPEYCATTSRRIVSYWYCYYRVLFPRLSDYPGFQFAREIGLWQGSVAPRIANQAL